MSRSVGATDNGGMRLPRHLFIACCLVGFIAPAPVAASAACVAPTIEASPTKAAPGESFTVNGRYFAAECRDVVVCDVGKPCPSLTPSPASRGIHLDLRQGSRSFRLATVNARSDYTFSAPVRVPAQTRPGAATLVADGQWTAPFRVSLANTGGSAPIWLGAGVLILGIALRIRFARTSSV